MEVQKQANSRALEKNLLQEKRKHFRSSHQEALWQKGVQNVVVLHHSCSELLAKNYKKYL